MHKFFSIILLEQKLAQLLHLKHNYLDKIKNLQKKIPLQSILDINKYKTTYFRPIKKKKTFIFEKQLQKKIKRNFDVIVFLGFNKIIHQDVLNITKLGILSFHTADTEKYRGRPSGFFEFLNNEKYGGVTLQRLSSELDKGDIVLKKKVNILKCRSYDETLYKMMSLKKDFLIKGLKKLKKK